MHRFCWFHVLLWATLAFGSGIADLKASERDWRAIGTAEDALLEALDQELIQPDGRRCAQARNSLDKLAALAADALTVAWVQVACLRAVGEERRAERQREAALRRVDQIAMPNIDPTVDLRIGLVSHYDARALAGLLGEPLLDLEIRLTSDWARIEWMALYVDAAGRERRVLFDATELGVAQLRRQVDAMDVADARRPWLLKEMAVFPAWWMYQSWRHSEDDEPLFAAAAASFGGYLGDDAGRIRTLAAIALKSSEMQFRVRHANWLLSQRRRMQGDTLATLSESLFGGGQLELDKQLFETLLPASDARLSEALALVAALSHHGVGLPKSARQRDQYLKAYAARRSAAEADYAFGRLLLSDDLGLEDATEGRQRLYAAARQGFLWAWSVLATHCEQLGQKGELPSQCASGPLTAGLKAASKAGDGDATRQLAERLLGAKPARHKPAERLLRLAAAQGDPYAPWYLVAAWRDAGKKPAAPWRDVLLTGMQRGDAYALTGLGRLYRDGDGVPADPQEACFWYERAAERYQVEAMMQLTDLLDAGRCPQSAEQARTDMRRWLDLAAQLDHPAALVRLSELVQRWDPENGPGEARGLLQRAAAADHLDAIARLGWMCEHGEGGEVDAKCALANYHRWAEQDADGLNNLARLYHHGFGVRADLDKAQQLYRQAAAGGSHHAQCNLAFLLLEQPDEATQREGHAFIERAAQSGNHYCRVRLGEAYAYGRDGRAADPALATRWLTLAQQKDEEDASGTLALLRWQLSSRNPDRSVAAAEQLLLAQPLRFCDELVELWLQQSDLPTTTRRLRELKPATSTECRTLLAEMLTWGSPDAAGLAEARQLLAELPVPLTQRARLLRARIALHERRPADAIRDLLPLKDDSAVAQYWLARLCGATDTACPLDPSTSRQLAERVRALTGNRGNDLAFLLAVDPLADAQAWQFAHELMQGLDGIEKVPGWLDTRACTEARTGRFEQARTSAELARQLAVEAGRQTDYYDRRITQLTQREVCSHPY